jgi:hypothetical protein
MAGDPREGCPKAARQRERSLSNDVDPRMRQWKPGEAPSIGVRWIKTYSPRKDAEMIGWYDRRSLVPIVLRRVRSPMGEPSCMNCPSRRWTVRDGAAGPKD